MTLASRFTAQCSPVIGVNNPTCGTITKSSIDYLTPADLDTLFKPGGVFAEMDAWFKYQVEMKACGTRRYAWYDWIMANADRTEFRKAVSGTNVHKGPSLMHPFILARQTSITNTDYWKVIDGVAVAGYTVNTPANAIGDVSAGPILDLTGATRVVRLGNNHSMPFDAGWFPEGTVIHIFSQRGNGVTEQGNWKVIESAANTAKTYIDLALASENDGSTTPYNETPTTGLVIIGINNINDYEKWCVNRATIDNRKRVPFWFQTWRRGRCVDQQYREVFTRLMESNAAFKEFGDLPLAEQNRQDEDLAQREFVNAFFFQKPISANQTLTLWESLDLISTPAGAVLTGIGIDAKPVARRANFIGVKEQLRACDQVIDLQGNPLNLLEFLDENYDLYRARKSAGRKVTAIDWFTNTTFRSLFHTAAMQYYADMYLDQLRITVEVNKVQEDLGMVYDSYFFKRPGGIRINIISDEFFDDWYSENDALGQGPVGNMLIAPDIGLPPNGSIYYAMIASNRKVHTTAELQELARLDGTYQCVMEALSREQTLYSETGTVVVECPYWSRWIDGLAMQQPVTTGRTEPYTNLY